jgi:hypothetical protein
MLGAEGNMDIRNAIMQMAASDPQYAKAVDVMEEQVARMPVVPEDLDEAIALLEFVLQNPDKYQEVLAAAVKDGVIDEGMMPPQFDQVFIVSLLVALYGLQDRLNERGFSRGGLSVAARKMQTGGRGGDTELVHVNRREAEILRRMGGAGTVNPNTGLREYKSVKKLIGAVLPIALSIIAPGIGTAIGTALGASGVGATILGGAVIGGASSALSGGNVLQGALMGGVGAGLGGVVGGGVDKALGLGLGQTGQAILGSGLIGGAAGAATGQGVLRGIGQGVLGGAIGELAGTVNAPTAFQQGIQQAGRTFGQGITVGYDPKTAAISGGLSGLATGLTYKPSDTVVKNLKTGEGAPAEGAPAAAKTVTMPDGSVAPAPGSTGMTIDGRPGIYQLNTTTGKIDLVPQAGSFQVNNNTGAVEWKVNEPSFWDKITGNTGSIPATTTGQPGTQTGGGGGMGTLGKLALGATALQALSSAPPAVQQAVQQMSPDQQEYFNRPSIVWDWEKLQRDAAANNQSLSQFMAQNWPNITSGMYNVQQSPPPGMAHGGALGAVARFARGAGSGRSDTINAKLSDGEYVMDAETVAMLGDGSGKAGAQRLDKMREELRAHKGKALAKGKFSPNAKSPLSYLKEVA